VLSFFIEHPLDCSGTFIISIFDVTDWPHFGRHQLSSCCQDVLLTTTLRNTENQRGGSGKNRDRKIGCQWKWR